VIWKWIGAAFILIGCGGTGVSIAFRFYQEERILSQLRDILIFMENELKYRLTPLPELCHLAGKSTNGILSKTMAQLAEELSRQVLPDPASCMAAVLGNEDGYSCIVRVLLQQMGKGLGRFDLSGQIQDLRCISERCKEELLQVKNRRKQSAKSYQTLGFCAGAALAVLFI